ncbi:hypothetical protein X739_29275 [Mesorhizobium sp. LNHC220B00]|nr:hypothetical protein [Mesorhizobium sp. LNHC220B00]ESY80157.1 hypothetical protein X739_29275 [Mesorhizobium sp. LNHC220B00]
MFAIAVLRTHNASGTRYDWSARQPQVVHRLGFRFFFAQPGLKRRISAPYSIVVAYVTRRHSALSVF